MDDDLIPLLVFGVIFLVAVLVLGVVAFVVVVGEVVGSLGPM
jgi:hypothetical protein